MLCGVVNIIDFFVFHSLDGFICTVTHITIIKSQKECEYANYGV